MAEGLSQILTGARSRWMIGGEPAPADHPLTAGQPPAEAELRLLAVAGQFQRLCQPQRAPALSVKPDLPRLALPFLPDGLRPLVRRLLADKADRSGHWVAIFVAGRGHVLHPADWLPPPGAADLPEIYRPLQLWQADKAAGEGVLTGERWLDATRAERLDHVRRLRTADPAGARAVLAEHLAGCPAEERVALVDSLGKGLAEGDAPFLTGLAADRSEKVRKAALHLLARLGHVETSPKAEDAAGMFTLATEGILRRRRVLRLNPKAKEAQLRTLAQDLPEVSLSGLARALGLTGTEFVTLWQPDRISLPVQVPLSEMIARTGTDADVAAFWQQMRADPDLARLSLPVLFPRLTAPEQQAGVLWLVESGGVAACHDVLSLMGTAVPVAISAALTARRKELVDPVRLSQRSTPEQAASARNEAQRLAPLLAALGLVVTASDATLILQTVTEAGLSSADPILDRLHLNAALKGS